MRVPAGLGAIAVVTGLLLSGASPALAADLVVTNGNDSGPGSLRAAIEAANATPGRDSITLQEGLTIDVRSTLHVTDDLDLTAAGVGAILKARDSDPGEYWGGPVLEFIGSGAVQNVSIDATSPNIWTSINWISNPDSALSLNRVTSTSLNAQHLEIPEAYRELSVTESNFAGGTQVAYLSNIAESSHTLFDGNTMRGVESGVFNYESHFTAADQFVFQNNTVEMIPSEPSNYTGPVLSLRLRVAADVTPANGSFARFTHNSISGSFTSGTPITVSTAGSFPDSEIPPRLLAIESSTFDIAHVADAFSGVVVGYVWADSPAEMRITNSTFQLPDGLAVTESQAPLGVTNYALDHVTSNAPFHGTGSFTLANSAISSLDPVLVGNGISGQVSGSHNLVTTEVPGLSDSVIVPNPADFLLSDLAQAQQGLPVRFPDASSPVIDAAGPSTLTLDQRGLPRVSGSAADIGAVEAQGPQIAVGDAGKVIAGSPASFPITVTTPGELPASVRVTATSGTADADTHFVATAEVFEVPSHAQPEGLALTVPTHDAADADGLEFTAVGSAATGQAGFSRATGIAMLERTFPGVTEPTTTPDPDPDPEKNPDPTQELPTTPPATPPQASPSADTLSRTGTEGRALLGVFGAALLLAGGASVAVARRNRTR